ncbi:hypothetical protein FB157_12481 [Streptomyces sp. BK340]|nr:hypothetical protein FB157_12481 [Streptomyces sp. BK340]
MSSHWCLSSRAVGFPLIETIVFDTGETLTRDDRYWASWADRIGVPRRTLSALVGAVVAEASTTRKPYGSFGRASTSQPNTAPVKRSAVEHT